MVFSIDLDNYLAGGDIMIIDAQTNRIDAARVEYALQTVINHALNSTEYLARDLWASATLRVAMKRHDVMHGVRPPDYETKDAAKLLDQFRAHPVAKEYGLVKETDG